MTYRLKFVKAKNTKLQPLSTESVTVNKCVQENETRNWNHRCQSCKTALAVWGTEK